MSKNGKFDQFRISLESHPVNQEIATLDRFGISFDEMTHNGEIARKHINFAGYCDKTFHVDQWFLRNYSKIEGITEKTKNKTLQSNKDNLSHTIKN